MDWSGIITLLAPAVAIALALITRKVLPSLSAGILTAAVVASQSSLFPTGEGAQGCLLEGSCEGQGAILSSWGYLYGALFDIDNFSITVFTLFVSMMVAVMTFSGATERVVAVLLRVASDARSTMLASWLAGFAIFFDDYANCLVVGRSMGPVCDRSGVSRAKLAYIVDSTAAPVASLTLVSTWVGYEVGLIDKALDAAGAAHVSAYGVFVEALPYRFYGLFALALVGIVAWTGRDVGPMLQEERAARRAAAGREPATSTEDVTVGQALWAASPVLVLVFATLIGLVVEGRAAYDGDLATAAIYDILGAANPFPIMVRGGLLGLLWAVAQGLVGSSRSEVGKGLYDGAIHVLPALGVLYLAWGLGNAIGATDAQQYLAGTLEASALAEGLLPSLTFVIAGLTAMATGTSFGTMAILIPLVVPLAVPLSVGMPWLLPATTSAVLAGSCMGDHVSPISDTTVLSATGAGVDLVTHVRTQIPYVGIAGAVSLVLGYLPAGWGVSPWLCIPVGWAVLYFIMTWAGQRVELASPGTSDAPLDARSV